MEEHYENVSNGIVTSLETYQHWSQRKSCAWMIMKFHLKSFTVQESGHHLVHPIFVEQNACTWPASDDLNYFGRSRCWRNQ